MWFVHLKDFFSVSSFSIRPYSVFMRFSKFARFCVYVHIYVLRLRVCTHVVIFVHWSGSLSSRSTQVKLREFCGLEVHNRMISYTLFQLIRWLRKELWTLKDAKSGNFTSVESSFTLALSMKSEFFVFVLYEQLGQSKYESICIFSVPLVINERGCQVKVLIVPTPPTCFFIFFSEIMRHIRMGNHKAKL